MGSLLVVNHEGTVLETHQVCPDNAIEKLTWSTTRSSGILAHFDLMDC